MPRAHPKSVLITGCGGFLGRRVHALLRKRFPAARLHGLSRAPAPAPGMSRTACDGRDTPALIRVLRRKAPDWILHCAGTPASNDAKAMVEGHLLPTLSLLEAARRSGKAPRIVLPGSSGEYGFRPGARLPWKEDDPPYPITAYGAAKAAETAFARFFARNGADVMVARIFNLIGPGLPLNLSIASFVRQVAEIERGDKPALLETGNLSPKRDFVDVGDAAAALLLLAERGENGEAYNVCTGRSVSVSELVGHLLSLSRRPIRHATRASRVRGVDIPDIRGSLTKTSAATGWRPRVSWKDSLESMLEHDRALLAARPRPPNGRGRG